MTQKLVALTITVQARGVGPVPVSMTLAVDETHTMNAVVVQALEATARAIHDRALWEDVPASACAVDVPEGA